ncbi:DUF4396 domain-containing protein [Bradyrhizobium sp. SZCCHNS3051]|uniref:DUF4396 domain-containing protein n=1 Tax=Bradyrhizobium sp. SZCCHNS3051 TaxID=3057320 RepID=UPI002916AE39|nr:DUF4396 domain-containing protein [Bradyrhizobium sp. SZCCHNS3051]
MLAVWIIDFLRAYGFGRRFRYFTIAPMRGLSLGQGLIAAAKADTISIASWQVGMHGFTLAISTASDTCSARDWRSTAREGQQPGVPCSWVPHFPPGELVASDSGLEGEEVATSAADRGPFGIELRIVSRPPLYRQCQR